MDFNEIAVKWQKKWEESKLFETNPDDRKKFFVSFPYPYINAYQHIGHLFTLMRVEAYARYKRARGFNVLFAQGWHATGSPIVNAAKRVAEGEEKQIKIMKDMGFSDSEIKKFEKPEYWIEFFAPEFKKDYQSIGMSVDWRRTFHTTSLNPYYDKFVRWQFHKLKEKNLVVKGKFPVVWDPKDNSPVGDHDRVEGEGETPQEFLLVKHKLSDGRFVVSATLRPDTILGITNLYVHPEVEYKEVDINNEKWIIGDAAIGRLQQQGHTLNVTNTVKGIDLIGEKTEEIDGHKVLILPATFLDPNFGTGLVHSVPSDSADDLIALYDFQKDEKTIEKYGLNKEEVQAIKPIAVLDTPGHGGIPAQVFLDKYEIKSQNERGKLDKIREELYKLSFYTATYNSLYKDFFDKDLQGKKVDEGKDYIKKEIINKGWGAVYYQLTGKVVSRSLTECIVKIVDDQWFIDYGNEEWKAKTHKCLDNLKLYPEKSRTQFNYVIDWLHEWACTREEGLGTRLPWDEKWLIESLSDSTIYLAYYTIAHLLTDVAIEDVNDELFDYVMLGKGDKPNVAHIDEMRKSFDYYYPHDFRNSGKDLIQNHLTFFLFTHTAIFPEDKWPQGIGANGWVTVDGQKMSKSLGNMVPVREVVKQYSPDAARITILNGGEEMDDPNWDSGFAKSIKGKLGALHTFCAENYSKSTRIDEKPIDKWFESKIHSIIAKATTAMENTLFRTAIQQIYFEMQKTLKHYLRRSDARKDLLDFFIETQLVMLAPFCPHLCEETWEAIGKKDFISAASWPSSDSSKIDSEAEAAEETVAGLISDIRTVMDLLKKDKANTIKLIISPSWKYSFYSFVKNELSKSRDVKALMGAVMSKEEFKKHGQDVTKLLPTLVKDPSKIPEVVLSQEKELENVNKALSDVESTFGAKISVEVAEESSEAKARNAAPAKPAILLS